MSSPFSLTAALRFGVMFLVLEIAGALAQRKLGHGGFYLVSFFGGFVSSASAVASAANLAAAGHAPAGGRGHRGDHRLARERGGESSPVVRVGRTPALTRRVAIVIVAIILLGVAGVLIPPWFRR